MKKLTLVTLAVLAAFVSGCGTKEESNDAPAATSSASEPNAIVVAYELESKKKGDKGICVVCNKNEGTTAEEEVVETLNYKGKTYVFCNEKEKADFISEPTKFAVE